MPLRVPKRFTIGMSRYASLVKNCAAQLGAVTLAANKHAVTLVDADGVTRTRHIRDSEGFKPPLKS